MRRSTLFRIAAVLVAMMPSTACLLRTRAVEETYSKAALKQASQAQLIASINEEATKIQSLQATVDIDTSVGGAKKGTVTDYKEIRGYVLARKPAMLHMIGLLPIVRTTAFDMVSDGQEFKLWIPPKNRFIVGRNDMESHTTDQPMESIRPQDIYDALLIRPIEADEIPVLENNYDILHDAKGHIVMQEDYELIVIRKRGENAGVLSRKIVFSRTDLKPHEQFIYDDQARLVTDARYADYKEYDGIDFPSRIELYRPQEEYDIKMNLLKVEMNKALRDDQFALQQPPVQKSFTWTNRSNQLLPQGRLLRAPKDNPVGNSVDRVNFWNMINKMVVANLVQRPMRSLISVSAVALEVVLILLIVSFFYGQLNGSKASQMGIGADVMVQPPGSSNLVGVSGAPMPVKVGDKLKGLAHITAAAPVIWNLTTKPSLQILYGVDFASYNSIPPAFHFLSGRSFEGSYDVIVDDYFAGSKHVSVGDSTTLLNHSFRVTGIVEHGKGAREFIPLSTMQDLIGAQEHTSVFYVKADDPKNVDTVVQEIKSIPGMESYSVLSMQEWQSMMTPESLPGFATAIRIVIAISMVIGFLVIFQSMYTSVMERTREIGILKSLGASKLYIVNVILRETALLAVVGIIFGTMVSFLVRHIVLMELPTQRLFWSTQWVVRATVIALTGALLGALYPAFKAAQKDPIDALAYE